MEAVLECPICACPRRSAFAERIDSGRSLSYQVCHRCGHVFQSPRMSDAELEAFYSGAYRRFRQGTEEPIAKDLEAQAARAIVTLRQLGGQLTRVTRHLDFGSSSGMLIEAVTRRFGSAGVGVEPGEAYRRHSRARGVTVFPNLEGLVASGPAPFDFVTAMHVLEHLPDPVGILTRLRSGLIRPGAFLLVEVPNLAEHDAFEVAHLQAFTPSSLADAVHRAGFKVVQTRVHGGYRSPVLRLYITLLAEAGDGPRVQRPPLLAAWQSRVKRRVGVAKRDFLTRHYPDWTWQSPERVIGVGGDSPSP